MRVFVAVGLLFGLAVAAITVSSVGIAIWPGSMKLTAPVLCSSEQPDPFVVRTTTTDSEGTSTSFSLFCMGERGDFTEVGTWEPLLLLFLYTWGAFIVLTVLFVLRLGWRRRRRDRADVGAPDLVTPVDAGPISPIS
jgi:hypothetical protein